MKATVFFSWQSDTTASLNQEFIQRALELAVENLASSGSIEVNPAIDRDTRGVPGAPDIGATIFSKIDAADVFVADVTLINTSHGGRHVPNPNVLVELGYALKALGPSRILLVQNTVFGGPEQLPFDLRFRRVTGYRSSDTAGELVLEREAFVAKLNHEIEAILRHVPPPVRELTKEERWFRLLDSARVNQTNVSVDSPIQVESPIPNVGGNPVRQASRIDGLIRVASAGADSFVLSIPFPGVSGLPQLAIPFGQTEDIWMGTEGWLHVMLRRAIVRSASGVHLR